MYRYTFCIIVPIQKNAQYKVCESGKIMDHTDFFYFNCSAVKKISGFHQNAKFLWEDDM